MGRQKEFTGTVTSNKMQKTIVVKVLTVAKHPAYNRIMKHYASYKVHDEKNAAAIGDTVRISETRPLSKDKRFRLLSIVKKAELPEIEIK